MTTSTNSDRLLADRRDRALRLEDEVAKAVIGQPRAIRLLTVAVFARGHVLMEGDVGVGKTTLLRTMARAVGGSYERIEGTIDLLPSDLAYYTYIGSDGKPKVDPGPLLKHGESLSVFFFNEINRARPQVHSLLLRTMAERSVTAFNREYSFPHLQVFADRNRIEKEETYELPSAARDRFLMEILITAPTRRSDLADLMFEQRYHDADKLRDPGQRHAAQLCAGPVPGNAPAVGFRRFAVRGGQPQPGPGWRQPARHEHDAARGPGGGLAERPDDAHPRGHP
jgi:MoxR-like ATPase